MTMKTFRDGTIGPVVILTVICAVAAFALSAVYQVTAPIISQKQAETENEVRSLVMHSDDTFSLLDIEGLPEGITEAYRADHGEGFVIRSEAKGFNGTVAFMIGMDNDGAITGIDMFDHRETPGLGTKVAEEDYLQLYYGFADHTKIDAISGATITTDSLKDAITQAKAAFETVKGAS